MSSRLLPTSADKAGTHAALEKLPRVEHSEELDRLRHHSCPVWWLAPKAPTGRIPDRGLDAARPSAFYIDYGALTAFRSLKPRLPRCKRPTGDRDPLYPSRRQRSIHSSAGRSAELPAQRKLTTAIPGTGIRNTSFQDATVGPGSRRFSGAISIKRRHSSG
jgi:hypothetical protein